MTQRTASVKVQAIVDQSSIQTATLAVTQLIQPIQAVGAASQSVAEQLSAMGVSLADVTVGGDKITASLVTPLDAADTSAKTLIHDIGDIGTAIQALPTRGAGGRFVSIPEPDLAAFGVDNGSGGDSGGGSFDDGSGGGGGGGGSFGQRRGLSALGSLAGGQIGGGIGDAARIVAVGAAFGGVGVAASILALGLKAVSDAEQDAAKGAKDYVAELQAVGSKIAGGATTSDIKQSITDLETLQKVQLQGRDALKDLQRQYQDTNAASDKGYLSLGTYQDTITLLDQKTSELTGGQIKHVADIGTAVTESQDAIDKTSSSIVIYNSQLGTQQVILNDSAEAIKQVAAANKDLTDQLVASQVGGVQADIAAQQTTHEQRAAKITQNLEEQAVIHAELASGTLLQGAHDKLSIQYQALTDDITRLSAVTNTYADQAAALADAEDQLTKNNQAYLDNLTEQGKAEAKIAATEADIAQLRSDAADKAAQLQKDYFAKDDQTTADAAAKSLQIAQDAADKRAQIEQDGADKRAQIIRDADAAIQDATYGRNAEAAYLAEQKKQKDLADQKIAEDKSLTQLDKATKKAQDQNDAAEQAQYRAHYEAYQKELSNLQLSLNKEVNAKQLVLDQEQAALTSLTVGAQQLAQAAAEAQARLSALTGTPAPAPSTGVGGATGGSNGAGTPMPSNPSIGQLWTDFTGKLWIWNGHGWQPATAVRQYAAGVASVPYDGLAYLHQGERVTPAAQNRMFSPMGGGLTIHLGGINGNGLSKDAIKDLIWDELDPALVEAGYE